MKQMRLQRILTYSKAGTQQPKAFEQTAHMTGDERISLLESLRYELGPVAGYDYTQRLRRVLSYSKRA